jgi:hypothetical protein
MNPFSVVARNTTVATAADVRISIAKRIPAKSIGLPSGGAGSQYSSPSNQSAFVGVVTSKTQTGSNKMLVGAVLIDVSD